MEIVFRSFRSDLKRKRAGDIQGRFFEADQIRTIYRIFAYVLHAT